MGGASRFITLLTTPFPLLLHRHPRPFLLRLSRLCSSSLSSVRPLSSSSLSPLSRSQLCSPVKSSQNFHIQSSSSTVQDDHFGVSPNTPPSHPWSEWSKFIDTLSSCGHFYHQIQTIGSEDEFVAYEQVSEEFVRASSACLAFARQRSDLLRLLSRRDIVVVVENGTPFLFKSSLDTARRMRTFLTTGDNVMESDKAHTVDLMKYLLSYASNPAVSSDRGGLYRGELLESSVRNLFSELARLCSGAPEPDPSMQFNFADRHGQTPRPLGPKIEMKRGDWICPKCNFLNFARNMSCLECEESRPKRQLTGGEWECPQCDFFNYGRNQVCLRCDCKRPGEASFGANSTSGLGYSNVAYANKPEIDSRLAANEEKAQRWFSKISQMDGASDLNSAAADEDFPEIMPLRKGENRFVVSTRKTALERRLANSQYQRNLGNEFQTKEANTPINRSLNEILGRDADKRNTNETQNAGVNSSSPLSTAASPNYGHSSNYVPFVPFPDDMFANKPQNLKIEDSEKMTTECIKHMPPLSNENASSGRESEKSAENTQLSEMPLKQDKSPDKENELAEKSERWFKKVAELHDIKDLSAISDEDFPDIMPMRKGENRFVVSKKKDRSLTSPMYKRKMAMEQTGNTNFVPFVPFPSDYFAKKDNQPDGSDPSSKAATETSSSSVIPNSSDNKRDLTSDINHMTRMDDRSLELSGENLKSGNSMQNSFVSQSSNDDTGRTADYSGNASTKENTNFTGNSTKQPGNENFRTEWKGKSLEGSAVQEPDPLDMSEEAKAQRWFRRVAQIKDISELSQIPDEDFPSIMPMRKGVNRFVVSKRKTPLERRLTSPQYRRNLPIVRSDPLKKENEDS